MPKKKQEFHAVNMIAKQNPMRNEIIRDLQSEGVEVRPLIAGNMANKPMWKGNKKGFVNCELIDKLGFYVPNHQDLSKEDIDKIVNIINKYE